MVWCSMNKGIANLYQSKRRRERRTFATCRLLSVAAGPAASNRQVETLVRSRTIGEGSDAGFHPACCEDIRLFSAVRHGEHQLRGFRNADSHAYRNAQDGATLWTFRPVPIMRRKTALRKESL
jgi:hypothetical protein